MVRISVVIPTLNEESRLLRAVRSVFSQRGDGIETEILVVDGGSTDRTVEIAASAGCRVLREEDGGVFASINVGNEHAAGDLIGFLGADDEYLPGALRAVARWYRVRRCEWVVGGLRWTDGQGRWLGDVAPPPVWLTVPLHAALGWNCVHHQAAFYTSAFYERVGPFDGDYPFSSDYHFFSRALALQPGDRICGPLATFNRHGENLSMSADPRREADNQRIAEEFGAESRAVRALHRWILRLRMNLASPRWAAMKKAPRALRPWLRGEESAEPEPVLLDLRR